MLVLAIDTASSMVSLALHNGQAMIAEMTWQVQGHHTQEMPPMVDSMLRRVGHAPQSLSAIAVAIGPGSYTGLRIGVSLAKGIALACNPPIPLIGVPTLDVVAKAQHPCGSHHLCAVSQAGRGRVHAAVYEWHEASAQWVTAEPVIIASWTELAERITMRGRDSQTVIQIAGEIDEAGRAAFATLGDRVMIASSAQGLRRAGFLAEIACERLASGQVDDPAILAPIYHH